MAIAVQPRQRRRSRPSLLVTRYEFVTKARGEKLLDRAARRYLGMSGPEFVRRYRADDIPDPDRAAVIRVAMLIPFTGE